MKFVFPKDEELFRDLETVKAESYERYYLDLIEKDDTFGKAFRKVLYKQRDEDMSVSASGSSDYDVNRKLEEKVRELFNDDFDELEAVADTYADREEIGSFPHTHMYSQTFVRKSDQSKDEYEVDYFDEMSRATGNLSAPGRVGSFLHDAQTDLNTINGKTPLISRMMLIIFLVGAVVVLAGATPYDFLPQIVAERMNTSFVVRLVVLAAMALTGWYLVMLGPPEKRGLFKIFANGLFLLIVAGGSTLIAIHGVIIRAPMEAFELLPFGFYYLVYSIFLLFRDIGRFFSTRWAARRAKKDFCARVEQNIPHMHRYIRFHVLWWQKQNPDKPLPSGIQNLQKSFDHLLKMYKKYN